MEAPYPSFTLAMSQGSSFMRLPAYRVSHLGRYHPYPRSGPRRNLDFNDDFDESPTRTVDCRYDGPRLDVLLPSIQVDAIDEAAVSLNEAMTLKGEEARAGYLRLSSLVIDLAFAIRRRLQRRRSTTKQDEIVFEIL